ncbi:MAG TPA: molecular chaperone DnaJ [Gammaproteobacteria bacterium]|nr:molecular chaperone DnaJ [Gammaproteobacteria bacterium]
MDFPAELMPTGLLWLTNVLFAALFLVTVRRAPLARLRINRFSHLFFASCVALLLLWNTRAGVLPALNFHLLGVTAVTLMFGWPLALLAVALVLAGGALYAGESFAALGLNALLMGGIPVLVTSVLLYFAQRRLPHNFFVYVYVNAFLAAGLSVLLYGLAGAGVMLASDISSAGWLRYQYYPYLPMVFFAEAFLNGMLMTALVALRPAWVCSFDDELYLHNK